MLKKTHLSSTFFAVVLSCIAVAAAAQNAGLTEQQGGPSSVGYITGGVGDAQQEAMKSVMNNYTLRLTFARPQTGAYLADVKVRIEDASRGKAGMPLLDTTSRGPMLFARLPDGRYRVHAEYSGQMQTKTVSIRDGQAKELVYYFPEK